MKASDRMFIRYLGTGVAYGLARSLYLTHGAQIKEYSFKNRCDKVRPMLFTEKVPACILGTVASSMYWPYYIIRDTYDLELRLRGLADDWGNENRSNKIYASALDIVFG